MSAIREGILTTIDALTNGIVRCGWGIYDRLVESMGMTPTDAASFINAASPDLWDAMHDAGASQSDDEANPSETVWQHLFGTPERAAETLSQRELACTSSHVGVACFGLEECSVCPLNNGLCSNHSDKVDLCSYYEVLELLTSDYHETRVTSVAVLDGAGDER